MKTIVSVVICVAFLFTSCGNKSNDKEDTNTTAQEEEVLEGIDLEKAKNCEEFIDQYEKWTDDYLDLMEKYMKNPMDAALSQEYMKVAQEASNWYSQWTTNLVDCASKKKYEKRFEEISAKVDKRMEELGLE